MSPTRTVAPDLDGFSPVRLLGSGGFADVYLYEQELPRRQVAVKVLNEGLTAGTAAAFTAEANVMARLSTHPSIVTILSAGIASDGRPYLVMEHYPRANLSVRSRQRPLPVADALDVMIRISGAVETAHRSGIIHRDIKPANILTSVYGKPALTDFGIAGAKWDAEDRESGLSIPWCAPEVIEGRTKGDERSDVYSLAATLYTLLAGRSPFEVPGRRNGHIDLLARITSGSPVPLDRSDMPVGLKRVIAMGLDRDPAHRPASAAQFARLLQEVEAQLHLAVTPFDVLGEASEANIPVDDEDAPTRVRGATVVRPRHARARRSTVPGELGSPDDPAPAVEQQQQLTAPNPDPAWSLRKYATAVGVGLAVVTAVVVMQRPDDGGPGAADEPTGSPQDAVVATVPTPSDLVITRTSPTTASATWSVPDAEPEDSFQWQRTDPDGSGERGRTEQPAVVIDELAAGERPCLDVWLVRRGIASGIPASACTGA